MNAIHKPAHFYSDWYLCVVALQCLSAGEEFSRGLWKKGEVEHGETQSKKKYYHKTGAEESPLKSKKKTANPVSLLLSCY